MAYFTFSENSARRAIEWMCRENGDRDNYELGQEMVEEFMQQLGYDECLGLSSERENMIAKRDAKIA